MTSKSPGKPSHPQRTATRLANGGRDPFAHHGFVNPPVYHASTLLYPSAADYLAHRARYQYGRRGTPTSEALAGALAGLEGPDCAGVALLPSGLAAASTALLSALKAGDHVLVTDSVYLPTRKFCDDVLARYGIATSYYDPLIGGGIADLIQPNTRAIFVESPGSLSFDIQDVPAIAGAAHAKGAVVLMDNTWASPLYFRALDKGVDLSIQSGTKYIGGHSDVMLGTVAANAATWPRLRGLVEAMGLCVGLTYVSRLRGLRTMGCGWRSYASGMKVARWLARRPELRASCIPRSKPIPATPSGGATIRAPAGCSPSYSNRPAGGRARVPRCAELVRHRRLWGGSRASPFRSTARRSAPSPVGTGRADRAPPYRARGRRRPDRGSERGFAALAARADLLTSIQIGLAVAITIA